MSSNYVIFDFASCINLCCQGIRCGLLHPHTKGELGDVDFWKGTAISKILGQEKKHNV